MSIPLAASVKYDKNRINLPDGTTSTLVAEGDPIINRSITLRCTGNWDHANFHRIMSFVTQEFTERCGSGSRTCIWSVAGGGLEITDNVASGLTDIAIDTPVKLIKNALTGARLFKTREPAPYLRGIATIPQDDRMVFALDPTLGLRWQMGYGVPVAG